MKDKQATTAKPFGDFDAAWRAYRQAELDWHAIEDRFEAKQLSPAAYDEALAKNGKDRDASWAALLTAPSTGLHEIDHKLQVLMEIMESGEWPDRRDKLMILSVRRDICILQNPPHTKEDA